MKNFILPIIILLTSCASLDGPTPYQSNSGYGSGYTAWDLSKGSVWNGSDTLQKYYPEFDYMIQVKLGGHDDLNRAYNFAQRRAAEFSQEKGYLYYSYRLLRYEYNQKVMRGNGIEIASSYPVVQLLIKFEKEANTSSNSIKVVSSVLSETEKSLNIIEK